MRQEEEFAKDTICEWLNCNQESLPKKITSEPFGKDTAPDYMFQFDEKTIYVEVTRSGMGFLLDPQDIKFDDPNPVENGHDRIRQEIKIFQDLPSRFLKQIFIKTPLLIRQLWLISLLYKHQIISHMIVASTISPGTFLSLLLEKKKRNANICKRMSGW